MSADQNTPDLVLFAPCSKIEGKVSTLIERLCRHYGSYDRFTIASDERAGVSLTLHRRAEATDV